MDETRDFSVYPPSDDTILLADTAAKYGYAVMLEIGVGSGAIIREAAERKGIVLGTDISRNAIIEASKCVNGRQNVLLVLGHAADPFRRHSVDLIVINPPYLPSDEFVDLAVDGGKGGIEVLLGMLNSAVDVLKPDGTILFVVSSLTDAIGLHGGCSRLGLTLSPVARKKLFYEELRVYEAKLMRHNPR